MKPKNTVLISIFALVVVVVVILCIPSTGSPPGVYSPRSTAVGELHMIHHLQTNDFQQNVLKDEDSNGKGEFVTLTEILARHAENTPWLQPLTGDIWTREEYGFTVFLPATLAKRERYWCALAWPLDPEKGWPTYFVDQGGRVYQSKSPWIRGTPEKGDLTSVYVASPYESAINMLMWKPQVARPPRKLGR